MILLKLYAEIQANPNSFNAYRQLVKYYDQHDMPNEAEAFRLLIEEKAKNEPDSVRTDEKQPSDP